MSKQRCLPDTRRPAGTRWAGATGLQAQAAALQAQQEYEAACRSLQSVRAAFVAVDGPLREAIRTEHQTERARAAAFNEVPEWVEALKSYQEAVEYAQCAWWGLPASVRLALQEETGLDAEVGERNPTSATAAHRSHEYRACRGRRIA